MRGPMQRIIKNFCLFFLFLSVAFNVTYWAMAKYDVMGDLKAVGDAQFYIKMSQGDFHDIPARYVKRWLMPAMVESLNRHFRIEAFLSRHYEINPQKIMSMNFTLVNIIFLTGTALILFYYLKGLGFVEYESLIGAFLFFTSFFVVNYYSVPLVDSMGMFFVVAGIWAIMKKQIFWLTVIFILGVFAKETIFVLIPVVFLEERKGLPRMLPAFLPGALLYIAWGIAYGHANGDNVFTIVTHPDLLRGSLMLAKSELSLYTLIEHVQTFMFLWILFLIGIFYWKKVPEFPRKQVPLMILPFVVPFLVKSAAVGHVAFYLFPIVVPFVLMTLREIFNDGLTQNN